MIEINWTLIAQIINVLVLVFLLNMVLFRPIRQGLKQRQARMGAFEGDISQLEGQQQGLAGQIQESLAEARKQGAGSREALRQEGAQAEASLMEQVKKEVEAEWGKVEKKIKKDVGKARESLKAQAQSFAEALASKILGRELS